MIINLFPVMTGFENRNRRKKGFDSFDYLIYFPPQTLVAVGPTHPR